jgi:predicted O-linked N-acetylglucosamine transferase (SPINDLY family)
MRQGQHTRKEHELLVNTLSSVAEAAGVARERLVFLRKVDSKV